MITIALFFKIVHILWLIGCLVILSIQIGTILRFTKSKPPLRINLKDLINDDLCRAYFCSFFLSTLVHLLTNLRIKLTPFLAQMMLSPLCFWSITFITYLSLGIIVQYIHVHLKRTDIFDEDISQEDIRNYVRTFVGISVGGLTVGLLFRDGASPRPLYYPLIGQYHIRTESIPDIQIVIFFILAFLSLIVNVTLRTLIYFEKKKEGGDNRRQEVLEHKIPFVTYTLLIVLIIILFGIVNIANSVGETEWMFSKSLVFTFFNAILPSMFILMNAALRKFALKNWMESFNSNINICFINKIHPV